MAEIVTVKLVAETGDAVKNVEKVDEAVKKTAKTAKKASKELSGMQQVGNEAVKQLDRLTGGLASKLVAVGKAAKLSGKAMRTALISSGIGLAVAAVGLLVEYWDEIGEALGFINKDLERQVELNNQNLDAVGVRLRNIQTLIELRKREGKDVDLLLKKEKELTEQKKQAFITSIQDQALLVNRLKLKQQEGKLNEEDTEELRKQEKIYLDIINSFNKFKSDLLEPVKEVVVKEAKEDPEVEAKKRSLEEIKKLEADYALSLMSDENQEKIAVAAKYDDLIKQAKKYKVDTTALVEARLSEIKAIEKKYEDEAEEERAEARAKKMDAFNKRNDERLDTIAKNAKREIEIEQEVADAKANILDAQLDTVERGFNLLGQLAGKNKALQAAAIIGENAVGIAKQVVFTKAANAGAKLKYATLPGGALLAAAEAKANNISLGIGIASSVAATAQALSALKSSGSPSKPSVGADGGAQPPAFNIVGASGETQLADAIGSQTQRPARAYVVANDVTTSQELQRNLIEGASI